MDNYANYTTPSCSIPYNKKFAEKIGKKRENAFGCTFSLVHTADELLGVLKYVLVAIIICIVIFANIFNMIFVDEGKYYK